MIVAKVCACGRSYSAEAWAALPFKGYQSDFAGGELAMRDCRCGSTRALMRAEDTMCRTIAQLSAARRMAIAHARLALAYVRLERANAAAEARPVNEKSSALHLREAREQHEQAGFLLRDQQRIERLLTGHWRIQETQDPSKRIGRTLVLVGDGADAKADTEPPIAGAK